MAISKDVEPDGDDDEAIEARMCIEMAREDYGKAKRKYKDILTFKEYKFKVWKQIAICDEDTGFGQRALETDETRSATCLCLSDCEFLTLSKSQYCKVLMPSMLEEKRRQAEIFRKVPYFSLLSKYTLNKIPDFTREQEFRKGDVLIQEGERVKGIYIIKKGELNIHMSINLQRRKEMQDLVSITPNGKLTPS